MSVPETLQQAGFPPPGEIFRVEELALSIVFEPHPWFVEHETAIEANWREEISANPALFNGRMVFQHKLRFDEGRIEGQAHLAPYAAFLHWRKLGRPRGGLHLFGLPLILSSDNALIVVRMGRHTANAGRVYCAAGSLDESDIRDGFCDLHDNMKREVHEETGIDLGDAVADPLQYGLHDQNTVVVFQKFQFKHTANELLAAIEQHIKDDPDPEIECGLAIREINPHAHNYPFFMPLILQWLLSKSEG